MNMPWANIATTYRCVLNELIELVSVTLYGKPIPANPKKILLVRKGSLGDWICAKSALERLIAHFSGAKFDLLTSSDSNATATIYQMPFAHVFEEIISTRIHPLRKIATLIKAKKYDLVIELPADADTLYTQLRNCIFFRLCGVAHGFGWQLARTRLFYKQQLRHLTFEPEQKRLSQLLDLYEITDKHGALPLYNQSHIESVLKYVKGQSFVAMAVGAKLDKKKWSLDRFAEVADYLVTKGHQVVWIGDKADADALAHCNQLPGINLCGKLSISESAALLSLASLCVCNDSGPMHLAYTVGSPVVAIFSARNFNGKWNPPHTVNYRLLQDRTVACAGCMNNPCANNICMQSISTQAVVDAVSKILE